MQPIRKIWPVWLAALVLLATGFCASLLLGVGLSVPDSLAALFAGGGTSRLILFALRLPRIVLALLVGGALSVAGCAMQGLFRNPLADPQILGVSSGASFGAMIAIALGLSVPVLGLGPVAAMAMLGSLGAIMLVYALSLAGGSRSGAGLLLAGMAVGTVLAAATTLIMSLNHDKMEKIVYWTMGSCQVAGWSAVLWSMPFMLVGSLGLLCFARDLNVLAVGEEQARTMGVHVTALRYWLMSLSAVATAGAVSAAGVIGFVGLLVPHVLRMLIGPDHRRLMPLCLVCGGVFLIWMDLLARMLAAPLELPLGVLTSLVGGPFFIYLLIKRGVR